MTPLFLLLAALAAPIVSRRVTGDAFSPAAILVSTWSASVGLCLLYLIPYLTLQPGTLWFLLAAIGLCAAGIVGGMLAYRRGGASESQPPRHPAVWVSVYAVLGLAGLVWYLAGVVQHLGWSGFADGERLRTALGTYQIPSTFLVLQYFCLSSPLVAAALALAGIRIGVPGAMLAAASAAGTLVTTDRTQAFTLVLTLFFMWVFARGPKLPLTRLLLVGGLVPALLAANFIAVDAWRRSMLELYQLKMVVEGPDSRSTPLAASAWRRATSAYFYATGSLPALQLLLVDPGPRTGGALTFYPVARLLERAGIGRATPAYVPAFVRVTRPEQDPPAATNSYTFLVYPLRDFGHNGALAYSGVLGVLCGMVYAWARRNRSSPLRLVVFGQVSTALAFLPLFNKFNNTAWWYVLVWTVLPFAVSAVRRERRVTSPSASTRQ